MPSKRAWRWRTATSQLPSSSPVVVTTTERPADYDVKLALGQVFGVVVRSRGLGGNIMVMRFDSSELGQTMTEVVAYGTAAVIERSAP